MAIRGRSYPVRKQGYRRQPVGRTLTQVSTTRATSWNVSQSPPTGTLAYSWNITVAAGKVAADVAGFPMAINLADLPSAWWLSAGTDLTVRVRKAGVELAIDVVALDTGARTGWVYFKADLTAAADTVFAVEAVNGTTQADALDSVGRNAVFSPTYTAFAEGWDPTTDRTGNGHDPVQVGTLAAYYTRTTEIASSHFAQGAAWDGTNWFASDGDLIWKISSAGVVLGSVDVEVASGQTAPHVGDLAYVGGELFVACSNYPTSTLQKVIVFDTSLAYQRTYNITGLGPAEPSSICWNATASLFVLSDYNDPRTLHTWDSTFTTHGTLTLPSAVSSIQGIHWSGGYYFLMSGPLSGGSALYRVADDMSGTVLGMWTGPSHQEGITCKVNNTATPDIYEVTGSSLQKMTYAAPGTPPVPGWVTFPGTGHFEFQNMPKHTSWSMGATVIMSSAPTANRGIMSYGFGATSGNRASLLAQDGPDRWAIWNSTNGFLGGTTINTPTAGDELNVVRAMSMTETTTTDRRMYRNGVVDGTPAAGAQRPAGAGPWAVWWGASDSSGSERLAGTISTRAWVAGVVLSAAWLKAQYDSWENPSTFYTVAPASTPVSTTRATTWRVLASVAPTRATTWRVRGQVAATGVATWRVLAPVAGSRVVTWDVRTVVAAARVATWDVLSAVATSRVVSWDVLGALAATRATTWRVLAPVAGTRVASWDVVSGVSATRATTWRVLAKVTATRVTTWNVASTLTTVSATRATTWRVLTTVIGTRVVTWDVRTVTTATRATTWDVLAAVTTTRVVSWRVRGQVAASRVASWNVAGALVQVSAARSTSWRVGARVSSVRVASWDVNAAVSAVGRVASWRVLRSASTARSTTWRTLATTTATRAVSWDTRAVVAASWAASWDVDFGVGFPPPSQIVSAELSWAVTSAVLVPDGRLLEARVSVPMVHAGLEAGVGRG